MQATLYLGRNEVRRWYIGVRSFVLKRLGFNWNLDLFARHCLRQEHHRYEKRRCEPKTRHSESPSALLNKLPRNYFF